MRVSQGSDHGPEPICGFSMWLSFFTAQQPQSGQIRTWPQKAPSGRFQRARKKMHRLFGPSQGFAQHRFCCALLDRVVKSPPTFKGMGISLWLWMERGSPRHFAESWEACIGVADLGKYTLSPAIFKIYPECYLFAKPHSFLLGSRHHYISPVL